MCVVGLGTGRAECRQEAGAYTLTPEFERLGILLSWRGPVWGLRKIKAADKVLMGKLDGQRAAGERESLGWVCGVHLPHPKLRTSYSLCLREPLASTQRHKALASPQPSLPSPTLGGGHPVAQGVYSLITNHTTGGHEGLRRGAPCHPTAPQTPTPLARPSYPIHSSPLHPSAPTPRGAFFFFLQTRSH